VGVRYTLTLTPADTGARVVVRHRLPDGRMNDVLGQLESWQGGVLVIRRADGSHAEIAESDVAAAKVVPPAPERRTRPMRES
jgi:hypothetical protein